MQRHLEEMAAIFVEAQKRRREAAAPAAADVPA
jgi:hypothetical protein